MNVVAAFDLESPFKVALIVVRRVLEGCPLMVMVRDSRMKKKYLTRLIQFITVLR